MIFIFILIKNKKSVKKDIKKISIYWNGVSKVRRKVRSMPIFMYI